MAGFASLPPYRRSAYESAAARDVSMRLAVSAQTSVPRVFQLIGVSRLMPVYESLQDALTGA